MQSFASSIVASLVLSVLLFTDPTEAACQGTLTAVGQLNANYVSVRGSGNTPAGNNCAATANQVQTCKTGTSTANTFCATNCAPGTLSVDGTDGAVGANVVETPFSTTSANKYASTAGVAGTISNGQCGGNPSDVLFTAFTTTEANKYATTAGKVGTVSAAGVIGTGNNAPADVVFAAFTTASTNKYASTAGKVGTVSAAGVLGTGSDAPADVVFTAFTVNVPTGKFVQTAGKVGTVSAAGVLGTGTALPSDVVLGTCTVCDACQTTTTACVTGEAAVDGSITTQGVDTVCAGAACVASGAAGVTVSMAACGLAGVAAALRT